MNWQSSDHSFMSRAIQLAKRGLYGTHPNPRVGCVVVREDKIIAEGWHEKCGSAHAEVNALNNVNGDTKGTTCYVSLEPCNHQGHTGPCTEALIAAGVSRVVAAMEDPNPLMAGKGLARLREAGIDTDAGLLESQARLLNPGFIKRMESARPFVRCKLGVSLDGRTALADGQSKWITSASSRADVQKLRAASSVVMTGIGTVLADDPGLNVRDVDTGGRQPLRVVLDRQLRMPEEALMLTSTGRTLIFTLNPDTTRRAALEKAGAGIVVLNEEEENFLGAVMEHLAGEEDANEVLLEAGAQLTGAMLNAGLCDEIIIYQAPVLLGHEGRAMFNLPVMHSMEEKINLQLIDNRMLGVDRKMTYRII